MSLAEVSGAYVLWLPFAVSTSPGAQRIKAENRLGGSAESRGRASGSSWSATVEGSWGIEHFDRKFTSGRAVRGGRREAGLVHTGRDIV
jgi:hypothetical protein